MPPDRRAFVLKRANDFVYDGFKQSVVGIREVWPTLIEPPARLIPI